MLDDYYFSGILCVVLGAVILVLDLRYPEAVTSFFGVDPLQAETFIEGESFIPEKDRKKDDEYELKRMENGEGHGEGSSPPAMMDDDDDDDEIYEPPVFQPEPPKETRSEKRKSRGLTQRLQRPRRRAAPPVPDQMDEMDDLYDNTRSDEVQFGRKYNP